MNPLAPYMVWLKVAGCIGLIGLGWYLGSRSEATDHAQTKTKHAEVMRGLAERAQRVAELTAQAEAAIRIQEHRMAEDVAAIAAAFEDERNEIAKQARDSVLADIRAGRVQLRHNPAVCQVPEARKATASPGVSDGGTDVWAADAYNLAVADSIAIADEADAHVRACQAVIRTYRGPQ